jgi:hypothetical protein
MYASSIKSFDTSQAGVSDSLPESLPSQLDSQKPKASTHVGTPYPDIGILTDDQLSKHETKVNLLKSAWEPNAYSQFTFPSRYIKSYRTLVYIINNLVKKKQGLNSVTKYYSLLSVGVLSHVFL